MIYIEVKVAGEWFIWKWRSQVYYLYGSTQVHNLYGNGNLRCMIIQKRRFQVYDLYGRRGFKHKIYMEENGLKLSDSNRRDKGELKK